MGELGKLKYTATFGGWNAVARLPLVHQSCWAERAATIPSPSTTEGQRYKICKSERELQSNIHAGARPSVSFHFKSEWSKAWQMPQGMRFRFFSKKNMGYV